MACSLSAVYDDFVLVLAVSISIDASLCLESFVTDFNDQRSVFRFEKDFSVDIACKSIVETCVED